MDLALRLDETQPLHRQLRDGLREAILAGRLSPGQKMPSTRTLARALNVSRTTVCDTYEAMKSEGYLAGRRGSGTYVSNEIPEWADVSLPPEPLESATGGVASLSSRFRTWAIQTRSATEREGGEEHRLPYDFHPGQGAWDLFPRETWRRILARQWRTSWQAVMDYGDPAGYAPLREEVATYLRRSRAVACTSDQVVIVNGTQQALDLLSRIIIDPGDVVAVEDPGYPAARQVFASYRARLRPVSVASDGIDVDGLSGVVARMVLVAPSHQFPTGAVMSLPRRLSLLRWARAGGAIVIEDDYDSEFRFEGKPLASLQGLDAAASVVYLGSFSKVLFPSLRVGYAVLPRHLVGPFVSAKDLTDRQTPILEQQVLADFMHEGHFDRHVRRMRELYRSRRAVLVNALETHGRGLAQPMGANAGMHVMVRLLAKVDEATVIERAAEAGVGVYPSAPCYVGKPPFPALVMGYAGMQEAVIEEGVRRLCRILEA